MVSPCNHFESASLLLSDYAFADSYSLSFFVIPMASPCNHFESASLLLSDYAFADSYSLSFFVIPMASPCNHFESLRFFSVIGIRQILSAFLQAKAESIWLIAYNKKSLSNRLLYLKGFFSEQVVPLVIPQLHYYFVYTSYGKPVSY